ncbi:MAG: enoyl-CoA hydratase/isomerase family protein [Halorientalis sp.]
MTDDTAAYANFDVAIDDGIARVTMDSTSGQNAITPQFAAELTDLAIELGEDDAVRCLSLTGAGDVFGVGGDLRGWDGDDSDAVTLRSLASTLHDAVIALHQTRKPIVAGVNGVAAGASFSLAIASDIVLVHEDATFQFSYPRIGLTGDGGSTFFLPRLVGLRRAKEIALLDEPIAAEEAVDLGLATEAVPGDDFEARLEEMEQRLAAKPTTAVGWTKQLLVESFDRSLPDQLAAETDRIARATQTDDYERGYAAFFEGTEPEFTGQ